MKYFTPPPTPSNDSKTSATQSKQDAKVQQGNELIKPKKSKLAELVSPLKHYRYATIDETESHDITLAPAVKMQSNKAIPLKDIPFEETRHQLIEQYISILERYIKENKFQAIPIQNLAAHYLFVVSLSSAEEDAGKKNILLNLVKQLDAHFTSEAPSLRERITSYIQQSEYPIISWLKPIQIHGNFILDLLKETSDLTLNQKAFINKFKDLPAFFFPDQMYMAWLNRSFESDSALNPVKKLSSSTHYYHDIIIDNLLLRTKPKKVNLAPQHYYQQGKDLVDSNYHYAMKRHNLLRIQGRTLLFADGDEIIAVKVQKKDEAKATLVEEYQMANYLLKHQHRLDLQSNLPQPLSQYTVKRSEILELCNRSPNYESFLSLIENAPQLAVYVYKAPLSYFTYLHDEHQNLQELSTSVLTNVHDLFTLLREGIVFPQLADIFHTHADKEQREDKGRYQALVQLLNVFQSELGRIDKWKKAIEFVNLRVSGLADVGDSIPVTHLFTNSEFTKRYFSELLKGGYHQTFFDKSSGTASSLFTNKRKLFGNYLYLNTIAEYLLVVQLTLGSYGDKVTQKISNPQEKTILWRQLGELMFAACAETISLMTGIPQERALKLLYQRASLEKHIRQTEFWMTPDYSTLPEEKLTSEQYILYPGESGYDIRDELIPGVGLSLDGVNQDLGGYNQDSPLKELEKLLYATVTLIEGTMQLDKQFLQQLNKTETLLKKGTEPKECTQAITTLLDMARPGCNFQRRLALSYYEEAKQHNLLTSNTAVNERFSSIKQHNAATTIQRFWRNAQTKINNSTREASEKQENQTTPNSPML